MNNTTPRLRAGTIIWGCLLLVIAAAAFSVVAFDLREFHGAAVVWIVTGLGALFVVASIIALVARAVSNGRDEPELPTSAASEPDAPTKVGNSKVSKVSAGSTGSTGSAGSAGSAVSAGSTTGNDQPVD